MPEEKPSGMLISPMGTPVESLSEDEYAKLATCLRILNGDREKPVDVAFYEALDHLLDSFRDGKTLGSAEIKTAKHVLDCQISWWLADRECTAPDEGDYHGIFHSRHLESETLTQGEEEILRFALVAIRQGGWFRSWLGTQVAAIAQATYPGERHPSPQQIAGSLCLDITEWQEKMDAAKELAEMRPDLLFPAPPVEPETTHDAPKEPEPSQNSATPSGTSQRTHKPRRKARRAA